MEFAGHVPTHINVADTHAHTPYPPHYHTQFSSTCTVDHEVYSEGFRGGRLSASRSVGLICRCQASPPTLRDVPLTDLND